ncbi:hypothetical protein LSH36_137g03002 [Paralvinella palmiformis]|uniref:Uncharacterized protein n=1 Tax=Paralvinella palmiformis TaxID=53620 RepID=A0AAD9JX12_9ANNE|nr:hypothetical protein LSH36_137g03002 [Paralvinella palmiformis]
MALPLEGEYATLIFYVNGQKIVEENPDPEETLLKYLRRKPMLLLFLVSFLFVHSMVWQLLQ